MWKALGVTAYLLVLIAIGFIAARRMKDVKDYFAGSAAVRDWYQKVRHPDMQDSQLLATSRKVTCGLAALSLLIALGVASSAEGRTIFWFVIFGWSGIAATFCPTIILSLYWKRMTGRGALAAMITGFVCVPLFKFGAPALPRAGIYFAELTELPPAFLVSGIVGILTSLLDRRGQKRLVDPVAEAERV